MGPFRPYAAAGVEIAATTTSGRVALNFDTPRVIQPQVVVANAGTVLVFVELGGADVVAADPGGTPIPGGEKITLTLGPGQTHVAAVAHSDTADVFFKTGEGV
jgi:hypothetical protein